MPRTLLHESDPQLSEKNGASGLRADPGAQRAAHQGRDLYFIAEQPAPAPHLAHPGGCAALRIVLVTVPRVSRSCEHFPVGCDLHLLRSPRYLAPRPSPQKDTANTRVANACRGGSAVFLSCCGHFRSLSLTPSCDTGRSAGGPALCGVDVPGSSVLNRASLSQEPTFGVGRAPIRTHVGT